MKTKIILLIAILSLIIPIVTAPLWHGTQSGEVLKKKNLYTVTNYEQLC
ncbi:hypothetical protein GF358_03505 [Candidatus Woesearchaeota archaeon]|nr:hypothetical protein [Candidatus Woesearchaeota archaeon]